jgi:hypothetical protein
MQAGGRRKPTIRAPRSQRQYAHVQNAPAQRLAHTHMGLSPGASWGLFHFWSKGAFGTQMMPLGVVQSSHDRPGGRRTYQAPTKARNVRNSAIRHILPSLRPASTEFKLAVLAKSGRGQLAAVHYGAPL